MLKPYGLVVLLGWVGCASSSATQRADNRPRPNPYAVIEVDGVRVKTGVWSDAQSQLARRAKFDLRCEEVSSFVLLHADNYTPLTVGAEACGRRATYVRHMMGYDHYLSRIITTWVLDGLSVEPPTKTATSGETP